MFYCLNVAEFMYLPTLGYLDYFEIWAIINKAAINMFV